MQKTKLKNKIISNPVGALSVRNTRENDPIAPIQKNNGITLIALIITIIVMLILVGVTVNVALNGGLFSKARTAVTKKEEQVIYDQIVSSMNLGDNGDILAKETYSSAKNLLEGQGNTVSIVNPSTEENIVDSVEFTVTGNSGTYTYTITNDRIIIGSEEGVVYSFTLNSLGAWNSGGDSLIEFNLNNVWDVIGEDLSNNSEYALNMGDQIRFIIDSDDERFSSKPEENVQFLIAGVTEGDKFQFGVFDNEGNEILTETEIEGKITYEDFLNTYGDVVFRFVKVSSEETTE